MAKSSSVPHPVLNLDLANAINARNHGNSLFRLVSGTPAGTFTTKSRRTIEAEQKTQLIEGYAEFVMSTMKQ